MLPDGCRCLKMEPMHSNKMTAHIQMPRLIYQVMLAHLQMTYPQEGCGLLAGHFTQADQVARVTHLYAIENRLHSLTAYEMAPAQQLQAMLNAEAQGCDVLAAYHSHPQGRPFPSETDIAQAYYPELIHVIVSLQQRDRPAARAFRIHRESVQGVAVRITD